jgi:hypothetical protein
LGKHTKVDSIKVLWPDGKYQVLQNVPGNQRLVVNYANSQATAPENTLATTATLFTEVTGKNGIVYKHQETDYVDFKIQPLLPHKFSQNGPGIAVGDVDRNGLDDFYIGAATGKPGKLFYQTAPNTFNGKDIAGKQREEDMGSLFFDADSDGDQDLYVVSGGSEFPENSSQYQDRLYSNDGKGNFTLNTTALPPLYTSGSCVTAADYDKDGDLDLFVGGRIVPAKYPMPARSYILQNNGGKFSDITSKVAKELQQIGLVTAALWTDFDNDTQIDLVVTGEWMPVTFFKNTNGTFANVTSSAGIAHSNGWWNSLTSGDFDGDGDTDYVAGNLGLNTRYKASDTEPVCVYAKDYDQNGSIDPVLCYYIQGKNYPTHPRDVMIDQMNGMRGRFTRYGKYGEATFDKVLTEDELKGAYVVRSEYFRSAYIENKGGGKFTMKPLPMQAQVAPIFGMLSNDFDGDGNLDLLVSGNSYATEIHTGWYDASIGLYLKGNGKGNFTPVTVKKSGFFVDKDAKAMVELNTGNSSLILVSCNSDSLKAFSYTAPASQQVIKLQPMDAYAVLTYKNGNKSRQEFYYGSTYLSQSARNLKLPAGVSSALIYEYSGKSRQVHMEALSSVK